MDAKIQQIIDLKMLNKISPVQRNDKEFTYRLPISGKTKISISSFIPSLIHSLIYSSIDWPNIFINTCYVPGTVLSTEQTKLGSDLMEPSVY